ncbi:MAG: hypothetical protein D6733_05255 [Methanobacteriota archaeon]|nr:MAG: hypothetical protein D6733_05255 [Euryarchaeota archaeon]
MREDELYLLRHRLKKREEELQKAEAAGDAKKVSLLSAEAALLRAEIRYLESGGASLEPPDDPAQLEFLLKEKRSLLSEFEKRINLSFFQTPEEQVKLQRYRDIERILKAQCEYLSAKHAIVTENRNIGELREWIKIAEEEGVKIIGSVLEHEAEVESFRPVKKERKKKEFVLDFRKMALGVAVLLLLLSFYFGIFWRKTPYDKEIIRSYVIARNHYIAANEHYVSGRYEDSRREYAIAAAFFNKAEQAAELAERGVHGKMRTYFDFKRKFFSQWELISLNMMRSSDEFRMGDPDAGAALALEAVEMAEKAAAYNGEAEKAWRII